MATVYDDGRRLRTQDVGVWMAAAAPDLPGAGGLVLDLGAGTGRFSGALADSTGATVIALEPSAAMRAVYLRNGPAVPLVAGTAQAAPFRNGMFDAVWASQVIHHVDDLTAFAAGMRRILKPGGRLLLRGGFGAPDELPLYRYFPEAWATPAVSLADVSAVLVAAGIRPSRHVKVEQVVAESPEEFIRRVRTRSLSNLAGLSDAVFLKGLRALEQHADEGGVPQRVVEHLDLVVFRAEAGGARTPPADVRYGTTSKRSTSM